MPASMAGRTESSGPGSRGAHPAAQSKIAIEASKRAIPQAVAGNRLAPARGFRNVQFHSP